jgi:hypothetical protein
MELCAVKISPFLKKKKKTKNSKITVEKNISLLDRSNSSKLFGPVGVPNPNTLQRPRLQIYRNHPRFKG